MQAFHRAALLGFALALLGCHSASHAPVGAADMVGGPVDAGQDVGPTFVPAAHDPLPVVPTQGGPTIGTVKLVTVDYTGSAFGDRISAFGSYVVTSDWYTSTGAEYGVLPGTHTHVDLAGPPPASIDATGIGGLLAAKIAAGVLPAPDDHTIYMYYSAETTTLTDEASSSCASYQGSYTPAYHYEGMAGTKRFPFGVVPLCDMLTTDVLEKATAHELIEASTDTFPNTAPAYTFGADDPWYETGGEVADICDSEIKRDGHTLTRVWSNVAAKAGTNPCVPAETPYTSVQPSSATITVAPGATATFTITGWALSDAPPWYVYALPAIYSTVDLTPDIDVAKLENGTTAHVTITAPADAKSGDQAEFLIYSSTADQLTRFVEPIVVTFE